MTSSSPVREVEDPPHTRQSPRTLAAFRPWGSWRDKRRARGLPPSLARPADGRVRLPVADPAAAVSHWPCTVAHPVLPHDPESVGLPTEDSPSGLGRTLGKRVGGNPSGVRISYPPPEQRSPDRRQTAGGPFYVVI